MPSGIRSKEEKAGNLGTSRDRRDHATVFLLQKVDVEDYDSDSAGTGTQNAATLMQAAPAVTRIPARLILILK